MKFNPELKEAILLSRYKRFFADVKLASGVTTIHCANTGAMHGCSDPGSKVWYSTTNNPRRKLKCSLELVETPLGHQACVNTARANQLVKEALDLEQLEELRDCDSWTREVPIPNSRGRFDFAAQGVVMEVKMVSWLRDGVGVFPDAVSDRAKRHVQELQDCARRGLRAILLFCVPHNGIESMTIAADVDPEYAKVVLQAADRGVEILAYRWSVSPREWRLQKQIPFAMPT